MRSPEQKVRRAVRIVPAHARDRYEPEWRSDLDEAASMGLSERTVAKGATRMAWRLRGNWLAELFLGRRGLAGWLKAVGLFLLLTVVAASLGSFVFLLWLLTVVVLVVSLTRAVSPTKAGALVTRVSLAVWIFGTIYTVASFSVAIDAIDANV